MIVTDPCVRGIAIRTRDVDAERGHLWHCSASGWPSEIVIATAAATAGQLWWDRRVDLLLGDADPFGVVAVDDTPPYPTVERVWPAASCARASLALRLLGEEIDGSEEWGVISDALVERSGLSRMPPLRPGSAEREEGRICAWRRAGHAAVLLRRERHPICALLPTWP